MLLEHSTEPDFWRAYHKLPQQIRSLADKQFALLKTDPYHPSLHFKKVGQQSDGEIWSARITMSHRALAIKTQLEYVWFWIGDHKSYDRFLARF